MAQNDERAAIELDEQQLKKNPLCNHVVLLEEPLMESVSLEDGDESVSDDMENPVMEED